jgi:hypothetical protein
VENRKEELIIANAACFSKPRKGRKAAELVIANKELFPK